MVVIMAVALMLPMIGWAQAYQYKTDQFWTSNPRYLYGDDVGQINSVGLRFYIDNPAVHNQLFGFEYEEYYNRLAEFTGLVLPEQRFAFGFSLPTGKHCSIKVAGAQEKYFNDEPFSNFGIYPSYQRDWGGIELGYESDVENVRVSML